MMATSMASRPKRASLDHGEDVIFPGGGMSLDSRSLKAGAEISLTKCIYLGIGRLTGIIGC
jgi:hypothetical protein